MRRPKEGGDEESLRFVVRYREHKEYFTTTLQLLFVPQHVSRPIYTYEQVFAKEY